MTILAAYGAALTIEIPMIKRGVVDFAVSADWTPAAGDVKISKDGGAAANVTNLPTAIAMGNGAVWQFAFTTGEMACGRAVITVVDSATKAVEDQAIEIRTFGNASAAMPFDLGTALSGQHVGTVDAIANGAITANAIAANAIGAAKIATDAIGAAQLASDAVTEIQTGLATATALVTLATAVAGVQSDTDDIQARLPAALVGGKIDANISTIADGAITAAAIAANTLTAAKIATDAITAIQSGLATGTSVTSVADAIAALNNLSTGQVATLLDGLNDISTADVADELIAALVTNTHAEPSSVPAATASIVDKLGWITKQLRNRQTQSATTTTLYADDGTTADHTATVADDGTTFSRAEWVDV